MADRTSIATKLASDEASVGAMGQTYLAAGERVGLRLWSEAPGDKRDAGLHSRAYETAGYVLAGRAELDLEGERVLLEPGDSWVVPAGALHSYLIHEPFQALEATSPPGRRGERDAPFDPS